MNGIAAEISQEITVFLDHQRLDPGAGKEQAGEQSGWSAPDDAKLATTRHYPWQIAAPLPKSYP